MRTIILLTFMKESLRESNPSFGLLKVQKGKRQLLLFFVTFDKKKLKQGGLRVSERNKE